MVIYKTTNILNGKFYIGKDSLNNPKYFGSGLILKQAIKKYGKENFIKEILEYCSSEEELNEREKFWIKTLNSRDLNIGYNIKAGGDGGDTLTNHKNREELCKKFSLAQKARNYKHTEEFKLARRNFRHTTKVKLSMSLKRKGIRKTDKEYIEKLRISNIETYKNPELRNKIGNKNKRYYYIQLQNGEIVKILSREKVIEMFGVSKKFFNEKEEKGLIFLFSKTQKQEKLNA